MKSEKSIKNYTIKNPTKTYDTNEESTENSKVINKNVKDIYLKENKKKSVQKGSIQKNINSFDLVNSILNTSDIKGTYKRKTLSSRHIKNQKSNMNNRNFNMAHFNVVRGGQLKNSKSFVKYTEPNNNLERSQEKKDDNDISESNYEGNRVMTTISNNNNALSLNFNSNKGFERDKRIDLGKIDFSVLKNKNSVGKYNTDRGERERSIKFHQKKWKNKIEIDNNQINFTLESVTKNNCKNNNNKVEETTNKNDKNCENENYMVLNTVAGKKNIKDNKMIDSYSKKIVFSKNKKSSSNIKENSHQDRYLSLGNELRDFNKNAPSQMRNETNYVNETDAGINNSKNIIFKKKNCINIGNHNTKKSNSKINHFNRDNFLKDKNNNPEIINPVKNFAKQENKLTVYESNKICVKYNQNGTNTHIDSNANTNTNTNTNLSSSIKKQKKKEFNSIIKDDNTRIIQFPNKEILSMNKNKVNEKKETDPVDKCLLFNKLSILKKNNSTFDKNSLTLKYLVSANSRNKNVLIDNDNSMKSYRSNNFLSNNNNNKIFNDYQFATKIENNNSNFDNFINKTKIDVNLLSNHKNEGSRNIYNSKSSGKLVFGNDNNLYKQSTERAKSKKLSSLINHVDIKIDDSNSLKNKIYKKIKEFNNMENNNLNCNEYFAERNPKANMLKHFNFIEGQTLSNVDTQTNNNKKNKFYWSSIVYPASEIDPVQTQIVEDLSKHKTKNVRGIRKDEFLFLRLDELKKKIKE